MDISMIRALLVLVLAIAGISPAAPAQVGPPVNALIVDAPPQIAIEVVNRVPSLSNDDMARCVASHMGAMMSPSGVRGFQQATMRWTFEPLPDAGGSVKYIGPGTTEYPAPPMLRRPILVRVDIIVGNTSIVHREVRTQISCDPRRIRLGLVISRLSRSVLSSLVLDRYSGVSSIRTSNPLKVTKMG
jgi:hypothetical protein